MPIIGERVDHRAEVVTLRRPDRPTFVRINGITAGVDDAGSGCQHQHQGDFEEQPLPCLRLCVQISPAYFDDTIWVGAHGCVPLRNITRPVHPQPDS